VEEAEAATTACRQICGKRVVEQIVVRFPCSLRHLNKTTEDSMKTDKQVQQDVIAELGWEPSVNATHIGVEVADGVVTLAGRVSRYIEKANAERAAQRVGGVKALAGERDVKLAGSSKRNDADPIANKPKASSNLIKSDIEAALIWRARTDAQKISVEVQGRDVTLTGSVHSWSERDLARDSAWATPGVHNVVDKMTVSY
jgi:osmotically-inducible protein OsmY